MATQLFSGFLFDDAGVAVNGATVDIFKLNSLTAVTTVPSSITTDSNGYWTATVAAEERCDVRITNGASIRWIKYDDQVQLNAIETATLRVRNPADTFDYDFLPAAIVADRTLTLPLLTATATVVVTPSVENIDLATFILVGNGGSTGIAISSAGEVTNTAQPAFSSGLGSNDDNKTGNGGTYTLGDPTDLTPVFDQGSDFDDTTGIFTAPVTGRYCFTVTIYSTGWTSAADNVQLTFITTNRSYLKRLGDTNDMPIELAFHHSVFADMDASETMTVTLVGGGESSDVVDIIGDVTRTYTMGWLVV